MLDCFSSVPLGLYTGTTKKSTQYYDQLYYDVHMGISTAEDVCLSLTLPLQRLCLVARVSVLV